GPRSVDWDEFDKLFTGIVLVMERGSEFQRGGERPNLLRALSSRLTGSRVGLVYVVLASLTLIIPGIAIPTFSRVFVDEILIKGHNLIAVLLVAMLVTAVLRAALTWLQQSYLLRLETKLALSSSAKFFWHVLNLPVEFF